MIHSTLKQMSLQVICVKPATRPGFARRLAVYDTGAAQSIKSLRVRARLPLENRADNVAKRTVMRQQDEDAAEVIAERAFIPVGHGFE
jgi:hypothetical protein